MTEDNGPTVRQFMDIEHDNGIFVNEMKAVAEDIVASMDDRYDDALRFEVTDEGECITLDATSNDGVAFHIAIRIADTKHKPQEQQKAAAVAVNKLR